MLGRLCFAVSVLVASLMLAAPAQAADPLIAAAGDIACDGLPTDAETCQQQATSDLLVGRPLTAVLMLGDGQYQDGTLPAFQRFYDPTWGRFKSITHPVVGNHEYRTVDASGYFAYFGAAAGPPNRGYYSYDIGAWHFVALNSECQTVGGCGRGSPEELWLKADLAAHPKTCTLAYWHHPHFSSGGAGDDDGGHSPTGAFWTDLYQAGADLILNGHDHNYERFGPQTSEGDYDPAYGLRQIVVGTGGRSHYPLLLPEANSQVGNADTFGVLELTLHRTSYDWRFVPVAGKTFSDVGSDSCHGSPREPLVKLSRARSRLSRAGSLRVLMRCVAICRTSTRVTVTIGRRTLRSLPLRRTLPPHRRSAVWLKFTRRDFHRIRSALRHHRRLRASIDTVARAGDVKTEARRLRVQLRP